MMSSSRFDLSVIKHNLGGEFRFGAFIAPNSKSRFGVQALACANKHSLKAVLQT